MIVKKPSQRVLGAALAAAAIAALSPAGVSASTITWTGGTGNWSNGSNWTGGANGTGSLPSATDTIAIDGGNTGVNSVVTYDLTTPLTTSGELVIDSGDSLIIPKPAIGTPGTLTLGTFATGSFSNAGTVNLSGATTWGMTFVNNSSSVIANAPVNSGLIEATGGGTLQITDNAETNNSFSNVGGTISLSNGSTLQPVNGPIVYGGSINVDATSKIITNGNSNQVVWFENAAYTNHGTLSTTTNSAGNGVTVVEFNGSSAITNTGTLSATYAGDSVGYTTEVLIGTGTYVARGTSTPNLLDQTTFTNTGTVTIGDNAMTSATGTTNNSRLVFNTAGAIINDGQINVSNTGNAANGSTASINLSQNTSIGNSLNGTGSINFNDHVGNYIGTTPGFTGTTAPTLTLGAGQTLTGAVALGNGQLNVTNNGIINASGTNNPTVISTKNNSFVNNGTLHVSGAAGATIADSSFSNAGTLSVDNNRVLAASGSLTFTDGGYTVQIDSNTGTSGQIDVTGDLALGAGVAGLTVTDIGNTVLPIGTSFTLIDPSSTTGFFAGLPQGSDLTIGGNTYSVSYTGAGGEDVTLTSVTFTPEPGTFALFAIGGFALLRRRRANIA